MRGKFVGLADAVLVARDALLRLVLNARVLVDKLAPICAIVHQLEESIDLETFLHQTCVGLVCGISLSENLIVQTFHSFTISIYLSIN